MNKLKTALGLLIGLGCFYLAAWWVTQSALAHQLIGAGLALWLIGALVGAAALVAGWLVWFFDSRQ